MSTSQLVESGGSRHLKGVESKSNRATSVVGQGTPETGVEDQMIQCLESSETPNDTPVPTFPGLLTQLFNNVLKIPSVS